MPTDKQNVEFIWSIVKQLEVKQVSPDHSSTPTLLFTNNHTHQIDWTTVASSNSISNGHAARMRFHRLRQAMEGTKSKVRATRKPASANKNISKTSSRKAKDAGMVKAKKFAEISDDDEEPLASSLARKRVKDESDLDDERWSPKTEKKRKIQKWTKREEMDETKQERIKQEQDQNFSIPRTPSETAKIKEEFNEDSDYWEVPNSVSPKIEDACMKIEDTEVRLEG